MAYQSFEDLDVWKRACRLAVELIRALNGAISKSKEYALKDQMARAAISVPSNIAEGYERDSRLDVIRFLRIAKGSAAELRTQCYLAMSLELLPRVQCRKFIQECKEISAMLQGLIRARSRAT
ncbi:MAG: four helix bundle protein [Verrucomicrobiota bacterium]|jgi:four helix bundle protein